MIHRLVLCDFGFKELTYNVNTIDKLTKGTTGTVVDFVGSPVTMVLIQFDDNDAGIETRNHYQRLANKFPDCTPIKQVSFEFSLGKIRKGHTAKAKIIQFPLTLAWSITAHKCQGQTIKRPNCLVTDLSTVFTSGQTYVILGRVQDITQLYISSFPEKCIKISEKAYLEAENIHVEALQYRESLKICNANLRIATLNMRSIQKHLTDILRDHHLLESDILCFSDTYVLPEMQVQIPNYQGYFASKGRSSGVAVFLKNDFDNTLCNEIYVDNDIQMVHLSFLKFELFAVYKSPQGSIQQLFSLLKSKIILNKQTFICGDFNIPGQKDFKVCIR